MDDNNKHSSPLDELRSINERVKRAKSENSGANVSADTDSIEITNTPRVQATQGEVSRAEKVRLARRNVERQNASARSVPPQTPEAVPPVHPARPAQRPAVNPVSPVTPVTPVNPVRPAQHPAEKPVAAVPPAIRRTPEPDNTKTRVTDAVLPKSPVAPRASSPAPRVNHTPKPAHAAGASKDGGNEFGSAFEENVGRGVISSAMKAVIYIVCLLVVSGCLSLIAIFVGNDAFAFVKSGDETTITLSEDAGLSDIASALHDKGIIKYPTIFKLYCSLRHKTADDYLAGDFIVSPQMGYDALIAKFTPSAANRKELSITIIEGMDVDEIIDLFLENGIGTREGFVDVIQNYDFDFWFVDELDAQIAANPNSGRIYRLEGYLFPDTYNFYNTSSEADVIYKLLDNFNSKFDEDKRARAAEMGYTVDQIVTLASVIQKEAKFVTDYANVASVFFNRIKNPAKTGGKLESNATVQYTMPDSEVELALSIEQIHAQDNAYNTYLYEGLPVGSICNPSLNALNWALYPADTDYYYFVSDASGYNLYASTYPQHQANVASVENAG